MCNNLDKQLNSLMSNLENKVNDIAINEIKSRTFTVSCPKCQKEISAISGPNTCTYCKHEFNVKLDINF